MFCRFFMAPSKWKLLPVIQGQRYKRLVLKLILQNNVKNKSNPSKFGADKSYLFKETFTCENKLKETVKLNNWSEAPSSAMLAMQRKIKFLADVLLDFVNFSVQENMLTSTHNLGWYIRVTDWLADKWTPTNSNK